MSVDQDGAFRSEVFTLPEPARYVGAWHDPARLHDLSPDSLELRAGCDVVLRRGSEGIFVGATVGSGCASDLSGAAYATSVVTVWPDRLETWDRGFDAAGEQVWGAEEGPYIFLRQPAEDPSAN